MKLGKGTVYALLLALICFNILARLPRTDHETGIDSYFVHSLATSVSAQGTVPWVINALGYFGWYPLSYPSAAPLLISGVAQTAAIGEEGAILFLSIMYGILGVLTAFLMARTFRQDDVFALMVAMFFSLAPRFLSFTMWSASSRNLFMVLIPMFVWAMVRAYRTPVFRNLIILISLLVLMIATHRLTILLAVVVLAFLVAYVFILTNRVVRMRFPRVLLSRGFRRWIPWLALLAIFVIGALMLTNTNVLEQYTSGQICSGTTFVDETCNLGASITRSVGLSIVFMFLGVFYVVQTRNKGFLEAFLTLSLLALIPTLFLRQYTGFYILPFVSLFAALGVAGVIQSSGRRRGVRRAVAVAAVLIVGASSIAILEYEVSQAVTISNGEYSTALYLDSLPFGTFVANDGLLAIHLSAVSGTQGLPVGGAGTTSQSPQLLMMGAFEPEEITARERRIPLPDLTIEDDSPFTLAGIDALSDWQRNVLWLDVDRVSANNTIERYHLQYYIELDEIRGNYQAFGHVYAGDPFSTFALSVHDRRYKLYDGATEDLYLVFPPLKR